MIRTILFPSAPLCLFSLLLPQSDYSFSTANKLVTFHTLFSLLMHIATAIVAVLVKPFSRLACHELNHFYPQNILHFTGCLESSHSQALSNLCYFVVVSHNKNTKMRCSSASSLYFYYKGAA